MAAPNLTVTDGGSGSAAAVGVVPSSPTPEWSGDPVLLKDFGVKRQVPGLARVVKGSYLTLGASKFPLSRQHHDVYIHSVRVGVKVLAHCLKRVEVTGRKGRQYPRLLPTEQRLTIPIHYQGWFELLSEDGKASRPFTSVHELAKNAPTRCLVRENIKAYLSTGQNRQPSTFDKTKIVPSGEQLTLGAQVSLPAPSDNVKVKLLQCRDSKGDTVYLSFDQKGLFTPIAGESDFMGVFTIRDLVRRFRLPLTVKLAHGVRPRVDPTKFSGLIRLDWVYTEETAFLCPVEKNHVRLMPVPCDVNLHVVAASNHDVMINSELCHSIQAKCSRMVSNYHNTIHLIVNVPESVTRTQTRNSRASNIFSAPLAPSADPASTSRRSKSREDMLLAEIDDLYGYVRDGGVPPGGKSKFTYDSDEESYWEEPAYEPLDDFRARLKAMEAGGKVTYPPHYAPTDPGQLKGLMEGGEGQAGGAAGDVRSEGVYGVMATGPSDEMSSSTATPEEPPPLPPRPAEFASAAAAVDTAAALTLPARQPLAMDTSAAPALPARQPLPAGVGQSASARRVSAPVTLNTSPHSTPPGTDHHTPPGTDHHTPARRVSTSDSDPAPFPTSPSAARPAPAQRQHGAKTAGGGGGGEVKVDWKERLRQFDSLGENKDREGSSSNSSGSAPHGRGGNRLAKDFRDSDISSRTKASSSSSGNVRKKMQTLYL